MRDEYKIMQNSLEVYWSENIWFFAFREIYHFLQEFTGPIHMLSVMA